MDRTGVVVQARMGSTRLPGKVLYPLAGRPVLAHVIDRLRRCRSADAVVVATSDRRENDVIEAWATDLGVDCVRGSEEDTLGRFCLAAQGLKLDAVVRISADCPLIDPEVVDRMIDRFHRLRATGQSCDYLSNILRRTYPRGLDVEVFTSDALARSDREDSNPASREGVTVHILTHPHDFHLMGFEGGEDSSRHRWTLDTAEDHALLSKIFTALGDAPRSFDHRNVLRLLADHPEWSELNAQVAQREVFFKGEAPRAASVPPAPAVSSIPSPATGAASGGWLEASHPGRLNGSQDI